MMVQENVYKMAIMTLSSKLYLQWTTFVSIKSHQSLGFLLLETAVGRRGKEGLGWGSGGQRSTAGCCFLAEILLSIHWGHKQGAREHTLQFFVAVVPLQQAGFLPTTTKVWGWCRFIPMGPDCRQAHTSSWEMPKHSLHLSKTLISQYLNCVAFHTPCTMVGLRKKGGERRKEPIPALL